MAIKVSPHNEDQDWKAESDLNTLLEANKIRSDKKRHGAAKKRARDRLAAMKKVAAGDSDGPDDATPDGDNDDAS